MSIISDKPNIVLGIDPGLSGALAFIRQETLEVVQLIPMPLNSSKGQDHNAIVSIVEAYSKANLVACLEEQFLLRTQGATSGTTTVQNYGVIKGILHANRIEMKEVRSQTWHAHYSKVVAPLYSEIEDLILKDTKKRSLSLCKLLYPNQGMLPTARSRKPSDGMAEALLIARYYAEVLNKT